MIKFLNKVVGWFTKLQNFFYFIQAFQKGLDAFSKEWVALTGQKMEDILQEIETKKSEE